ncbi:MGDG synthase family glycosyltransferase [Paramaledivibacter caminithermalis]|uniref:Processive 1,2-diacylglycerol beta-glucosyltransferase n=1 Tax=Paramaledivibacter caminithermalis (strain DSM 15212 / CIP 107654 / DViRD3) TaxID=1121301 RepID=A0A1M6S6U6_PARC5|nr:glycosyltransferase [Paramaledivibacter caminithermalis]SHK40379.1 processive 1,2-diacylglycerol beta-glucosyltransferase [Paramaledivibacter caminithermalis DSM 15212]
MKKVLIFTVSTGGGHNQAAKSLSFKFQSYGYNTIVVDILKLTNKVMEKLFAEGYEILSCNMPKVYRGLYNYSNKQNINGKLTKYIYRIFKRKIYKLICEENPDLIIGTHPFIVNVISNLKQRKRLFIPFISVVTDFKAHSSYFSKYVDAYITGSKYTNIGMINEGIPEERLYSYGIPIRQEFLSNDGSYGKRDYNGFTILLMGGSMGIKSIEDVLEGLVNCYNKLRIVVVCGNNKSLMDKLKSRYKYSPINKDIIIYGFTDNIPKLMDEADILISKPGGLTVSEAIVKRLPILIPYMLPGQEEDNAEFLLNSGIAMMVNDIDRIDNIIDDLVNKPEILEKMKLKMEEIAQHYSVDNIVKLGERLINKYRIIYCLKKAE